MWFVKLLKILFPHGYKLAWLTKLPLLGKIFEGLVKNDELVYLTSDKVIPVGKSIQKRDDMILPSAVVEHFIRKANYHWIMNFCICRESNQCENYPIELGCLFMGQAVLGINPEFGRLVSEEEALRHVRRCREKGLIHVIGRNKLDSFWLKARPEEKLLTVCNCCECCCISRYLAKSAPHIKASAKKMPGVEVSVNEDCISCGGCTRGICVFNAISLSKNGAVIDSEECRACGRCVNACPQGAIEISFDDEAYAQKIIDQVEQLVDIT